jgi:tRNA threonylcarbamoyladenosine biosynthesis protein TsaB
VEELLAEAGLGLRGLDLIAFGRGPGAFTGVRLACSLAQGLALSAQLPVAPVSTLRAVAARALAAVPQAAQVLVCQDARMHEVYWARFARQGDNTSLLGAERLDAPAAVDVQAAEAAIAAGSGFAAYPALAQAWQAQQAAVAGGVDPLACPPRARDIARLAALDGLAMAVSAGNALPVYLRDKVASPTTTQAL